MNGIGSFELEWYDILMLCLRDGADILWLDDVDQNIYGKDPVALGDFTGYRADINYRLRLKAKTLSWWANR